jgi:hypothetical protein
VGPSAVWCGESAFWCGSADPRSLLVRDDGGVAQGIGVSGDPTDRFSKL